MSVDVSVVVPVYNSARFLRQCVDSLVNQTWKNVEFIFVDDGSTDDSMDILRQYREKDDRIHIVQQEHLYAGTARNNGMKRSRGKYIIFLDSDDYFDLTLLEKAFHCAEKNRAELVVLNHYQCDLRTGEISRYRFRMRSGVFSGESLGDEVFLFFLEVPWNKFLLRSFVERHHLEYQTVYKHNDIYFADLSVALAERIVCIDQPLVYYRINNPESLQGRELPAYPYMTEAFSALKQSLKARGRFHGRIRDGYNRTVSNSIEWESKAKPEVMLSKKYYTEMKQNLVPMLFDSPEDFWDKRMLPGVIYRSAGYDDYLVLLMNEMLSRNEMLLRNKMLLKKSKDYTVGHALLAIPRFIRRAIRYCLRTGLGGLRWKN